MDDTFNIYSAYKIIHLLAEILLSWKHSWPQSSHYNFLIYFTVLVDFYYENFALGAERIWNQVGFYTVVVTLPLFVW